MKFLFYFAAIFFFISLPIVSINCECTHRTQYMNGLWSRIGEKVLLLFYFFCITQYRVKVIARNIQKKEANIFLEECRSEQCCEVAAYDRTLLYSFPYSLIFQWTKKKIEFVCLASHLSHSISNCLSIEISTCYH